MSTAQISRRYARTPSGRVHYRRAGDGPPVVLLHAVPGSSEVIVPLLSQLADRFTVLAPDLPGWGLTTAPAGDAPGLDAFAAIVEEWLDALGLDAAHVYGAGAGAWVAAALAARAPDRVADILLDEVELLDPESRRERLKHVTPLPAPRQDGTHMVAVFHAIRDAQLFRPHYDQRRVTVVADMPSPQHLHAAAMAAWEGGPHAHELERAVLEADPAALAAVAPERVYAVAPLPEGLGAGVRVTDDLQDHRDALAGTIAAAFAGAAGGPPADPPAPAPALGEIVRTYVDTTRGQVHVRRSGEGGRPVVLLHSNPGGAEVVEAMMLAWGSRRAVVAPDMLGNGLSDKPAPDIEVDIAFEAGVMLEVLRELGLDEVDVWGAHTGALVAIEMAIADPDRIRTVVFDGVPLLTPSENEQVLSEYFISLEPDPYGLHLLDAWHTRRDGFFYWPWYRRTREGLRSLELPSAEVLHDFVMGMLRSGVSYHKSYAAAFRYPTRERLPLLTQPTLSCAGPADVFVDGIEEAAALVPGGLGRSAITATTPWYPNCPPDVLAGVIAVYEDFCSNPTDVPSARAAAGTSRRTP
jgi:pimeloyl-ACP methyl ester carboxylesterase